MKPAAVVLVLSLGVFADGAAAQTPWQFAEPVDALLPPAVGEHFGLCPDPWSPRPQAEIPDAFLWSDYRGACIEHDLYRPRYLDTPSWEPRHSRPILSALDNWLDSLFAWLPNRRNHTCQNCSPAIAAHGVIQTPLAPTPAGGHSPQPEAPLLAPVPLPEREPSPPAVPSTPVQPIPVLPTPVQPTPPPGQSDRPPSNKIPSRLIPPRTPIVELAPEPAFPAEPTPAPALPRNRVPRPGQQLPRNAVPR